MTDLALDDHGLFAAHPDGLLLANADTGRILAFNDRLCELLGYPREVLPDRFQQDLASAPEPYSLAQARARLRAALRHGVQRFDWRSRHARGHLLWLEVQLVPLGATQPPRVLVLLRDVDAERKAEGDRQDNDSRYRELQRLESLGLFAGGVAHEFNNLLVGVLGHADLALRDHAAGGDVGEALARIRAAAQSAAQLTTQLLAYSGRGRFRAAPVDLVQSVRRAACDLARSLDPRATLRLHLDENLPCVDGDAGQIESALENLLSNAVDALPPGGGEILVRLGARRMSRADLLGFVGGTDLPEGDYLTVTVSDTGRGMDEAVRRRVFDPFFSTKSSGRGMGLAAVLGIARAHRGAVGVESNPGEGSIFQLVLPVGQRGTASALPDTACDLASWQPGGHVLVVDDTDSVREVARIILERKGFQVSTASDGLEALQRFEEAPDRYDLVLLDMSMPRMGGEATLVELRRLRPELPVILCSGYDPQETASRFQDSQAVGFLQKPFESDDLLLAVFRTLRTP